MKIRLTVWCTLFLIPFFNSAPALANDFRLSKDGVGPVIVSMKIDIVGDTKEFDPFPRKKAEITMTAQNESGLPIRYASLCVQAMWLTKGCDFQVSTHEVWQPGEVPRSDLRPTRKCSQTGLVLERDGDCCLHGYRSQRWSAGRLHGDAAERSPRL